MKDIYFTPDETKQSNILDLASNIKEIGTVKIYYLWFY